jgi:hypothetical protein
VLAGRLGSLPLVITSRTDLSRSKTGGLVIETGNHVTSAELRSRRRRAALSTYRLTSARGGTAGAITPAKAPKCFGGLANLAMIDLAASGALTRQQLGWNPAGPDSLTDTDLCNRDHRVA